MNGGATGQWNVWLVNNPLGYSVTINPNPSPNIGSPYSGFDGIGNGAFQPNPGDLIQVTVTYNPSTNTLSGMVIDLNTGQTATFTISLNGYFTPPPPGNYVFGIGASTWPLCQLDGSSSEDKRNSILNKLITMMTRHFKLKN